MVVRSLPSRGRGLKFCSFIKRDQVFLVAPFAGAWIEMYSMQAHARACAVAPFAGAWIEIL